MPDLERWKMPHRSVDMRDWEVAKNMAGNVLRPDRTKLLDLYDSILVDSHLASAMESRVLRVVRSRYRLMQNGKPRPDLLPLLETQWFEDFLQYVAEAAFRGHTLIELGDLVRPGELRNVTRIDPRNVLPWSGMVVRRQGEEFGYPFREAPLNAYLIEIGRADDMGLLCDVGPVAIVKKYAIGSWSDYVHKYGIPPRWVKTNSRDARRFKQLEQMMQDMISSAYGVIEGDEEIQIMQTPGTDAYRVFDELIKRMNSEISKRLLGQDGTSDNKDASGTYGSLKVLQGVAEDRHAADKASVGYIVNNELLPRLTALGYPFKGVRFEWDGLRDLAPMELVDAVAKLGMVMDIDPKYVEERTGIKILGPRRMPGEVGGADPGNPPGSGRQGGSQPTPNKPENPEEDDEEDGVTAQWPRAELGSCGVCGGRKGIRAEQAPQLAGEVMEQLLTDVHAGAEWSQPYFEAVRDVYQEGLLRSWGRSIAALDYDAPDHAARWAMEVNLTRFSAAKTLAVATEMNAMVRESNGFADFKQRVDESGIVDRYNKRWLATEHQTAVLTGMQASRWFDLVRNADAVPFAEYWTQGDAQVRPPHAALDGKRWPITDPILNTIAPPNGDGCRCTLVGSVDGPIGAALDEQRKEAIAALENSGELARMKKRGFASNRAITGEVFKLNASYKEQLADWAGKPQTFGLRDSYGDKASGKDWQSLMRSSLPSIHSTTPTTTDAQQWLSRNANEKGVVVMTDHAGRPVRLEAHTMAKKLNKEPGRAELVDQLPGVLSQPDEVWLDQRGDLVYLKFTDKGALRVPVIVDQAQGIRVRTFYLDAWDEHVDKQRSGLLIKRYQ